MPGIQIPHESDSTAIRNDLRDHRDEFHAHEELDRLRFLEGKKDLKDTRDELREELMINRKETSDVREIVANMRGRMGVIGAGAILFIPILTELMHKLLTPSIILPVLPVK